MHCSYPDCQVTREGTDSKNWKEDRLCVVHAIMLHPEKYSYLLPRVKVLAKEILQYIQ